MRTVADNLAALGERIARAASRHGRQADEVRLVAVTKYVASEVARQVVAAGCHDLAESRPQGLWQKAAELADLPVRWHLVGHLQRNKVERSVPLIDLWHSADSRRILAAVDEAAARSAATVDTLLEVNISGDAAKHGFAPDEVEPLLDALAGWPRLRVCGLMAMSGLESDVETSRGEFAALRELRDRLRSAWTGRYELAELSMGMSDDFEAAVAEGATIVRIGSALFEGLP